jgi:hypothetical protein
MEYFITLPLRSYATEAWILSSATSRPQNVMGVGGKLTFRPNYTLRGGLPFQPIPELATTDRHSESRQERITTNDPLDISEPTVQQIHTATEQRKMLLCCVATNNPPHTDCYATMLQ